MRGLFWNCHVEHSETSRPNHSVEIFHYVQDDINTKKAPVLKPVLFVLVKITMLSKLEQFSTLYHFV